MGQVHTNSTGELAAIDSSGNPIALEKGKGVKFTQTGTYYFLLGGHDALVHGAQLWWDGSITGSAVVETCSFPRLSSENPLGVTDYDSSGLWVTQNPTSAYIPTANGCTIAAATVTITGGAAVGSTEWNLGNVGTARKRLKLIVTAIGTARCATFGKD